jgi:hypothetical protein
MTKFEWIWIPQGLLCFLGVILMVSTLLGPMSELLKFIVIMGGFCIFMIGLFLEEIVQKFKTRKMK